MYLRNMGVIILYYVVLGTSSLIKQKQPTNHNRRWSTDPSATARQFFVCF
jgi:hypothetical protein